MVRPSFTIAPTVASPGQLYLCIERSVHLPQRTPLSRKGKGFLFEQYKILNHSMDKNIGYSKEMRG